MIQKQSITARIGCYDATSCPNSMFRPSLERRASEVLNDDLIANFEAIHGDLRANWIGIQN